VNRSSARAAKEHGLGSLEQLLDALGPEGPEDKHAGARQKRRVQLEGRVLGGGADEHHGAVFHDGQEGILLRTVEAMYLVDEEQCLAALRATQTRRLEDLLQVGDAGKDRRDLLEGEFRFAG
jgi:hypothetical protein